MNLNSLEAAYFLGLTSNLRFSLCGKENTKYLLQMETFFLYKLADIPLISNDCRGKMAGACFKLNIQLASTLKSCRVRSADTSLFFFCKRTKILLNVFT